MGINILWNGLPFTNTWVIRAITFLSLKHIKYIFIYTHVCMCNWSTWCYNIYVYFNLAFYILTVVRVGTSETYRSIISCYLYFLS